MHAHSRYWHSNHYFYQHVLKSLPPWRSEFIATTTSLESGGADMIEIQSLDKNVLNIKLANTRWQLQSAEDEVDRLGLIMSVCYDKR